NQPHYFFFFQAEDGIRDSSVTGVQTCALPISITKALELEPEFADRFYEIRSEADLALGQSARALQEINLASDLPHSDRSVLERRSEERRVGKVCRGGWAEVV